MRKVTENFYVYECGECLKKFCAKPCNSKIISKILDNKHFFSKKCLNKYKN